MGCLKGMVWLVLILIGLAVVGGIAGTQRPKAPEVAEIRPQLITERPVVLKNAWRMLTDVSKIDDSKSVYLTLPSENELPQRFGGTAPAVLTLRCLENKTAAIFQFAGNFMTSIQRYGEITYRVDDRPARTQEFVESTDNEALGLWSGGAAIPFIKSLTGATTLYVRAVPFNESPMEAEFNIAGLSDNIGELRAACGW